MNINYIVLYIIENNMIIKYKIRWQHIFVVNWLSIIFVITFKLSIVMKVYNFMVYFCLTNSNQLALLWYHFGSVKGPSSRHHDIKPKKNKLITTIFLLRLYVEISRISGKPMWLQKAWTMNTDTKWPVLWKM